MTVLVLKFQQRLGADKQMFPEIVAPSMPMEVARNWPACNGPD